MSGENTLFHSSLLTPHHLLLTVLNSARKIPHRIRPAPIHPHSPILSPSQNQAKKAAKTGSMDRMIAVRVGVVRAWAQVCPR